MKTIVLLASGTRGDVQPYLALGMGLQAAGYRVRAATHAGFRALVERCGLDFALVDGNPTDLMTQPGGQSALTFDGNWLRSARATQTYLRAARPLYDAHAGQRLAGMSGRRCRRHWPANPVGRVRSPKRCACRALVAFCSRSRRRGPFPARCCHQRILWAPRITA